MERPPEYQINYVNLCLDGCPVCECRRFVRFNVDGKKAVPLWGAWRCEVRSLLALPWLVLECCHCGAVLS